MSFPFARQDQGQALVVIALACAVLMASLALAVDWGYGLTQRRAMQNAADAAALASARLLAANVINTQSGYVFAVYERQAYCAAVTFANDNRAFRPSSATESLVVEWSATGTADSFTPFSTPTPDCSNSASVASGPFVDPSARYIRAESGTTYQSLVAQIAGQPTITAQATAVARITGAIIPASAPSWPMVRHFHAADFTSSCGNPCNPLSATPVIFWNSNDPNIVYNNFMGLVDGSRFSPNEHRSAGSPSCVGISMNASCVPQLVAAWDQSGQSPVGKPAVFGGNACWPNNGDAITPPPSGTWYTNGNESSQSFDKDCSILNWIAYLYRGTLSLSSDWSGITWNGTTEFREAPLTLSASRSSCTQVATIPQLPAPSCAPGRSYLGDWIEAAQTGNVGNNIATPLQWYIDTYGAVDPVYSSQPVSRGNGAPLFGKYVVIDVYLWDCAETFRPGDPPGSQWSLTRPKHGSDCSSIQNGNEVNSQDSIDRVHLFSLAPFTFYRGLVDSNSIKGFWGGLVADPGTCATNPSAPGCSVNQFSNGVSLVPPP